MLETLPLYSDDLLKDLDALYGSYTPTPSNPTEEMWYRLGQQSIVKQLKRMQEENEFTPRTN